MQPATMAGRISAAAVLSTALLTAAGCGPDTATTQGGGVTRTPGAAGALASQPSAAGGAAPIVARAAGSGSTATAITPVTMTLPPPVAAATPAPSGAAGKPAALPTGMVTPPPPAAAAGAMAPPAGMTVMSNIPMATGDAPKLPEIKGECPEFKNGTTIMVAGHKSIQIQVGAPGKGGPLLFYWHGTGSSAAESARFPGNSEIVAAGGIVAAFNGSQSSGTGGDCSGTGAHNIADFDAADQIAACAVKNHGVDARRIYSTGCSAGGLQTGCMAQMRSSYLAAVAPNSGGVVSSRPWQDMHTPAVFTMHGGSSDMVIVTFSQTSATFDMASKSHGGFVVNCNHGGGHCAAPADLQKSAWQFMKDHPWGTKSPWAGGIPAGVPDYCKIY